MKTIFAPETQLDLFSLPAEEIARQLCIIEFRLFSKIKVSALFYSNPKLEKILKLLIHFL
jgi:hypothetical protein